MRIRLFSILTFAALLILAAASFAASAKGPLKILSVNPRYFTDGSGKAVFLTGSHTWNNLVEINRLQSHPTPAVDFGNYLSFLKARNHNCFRLWAWENAASFDSTGKITYQHDPMPYLRSGPGNALDGKPRFDLNKFNPVYFDRLRSRVIAARDSGMYVIVMLFQGFSILDKGHDNPWKGHPLNAANNINKIDGDPDNDGKGLEAHSLAIPALTAFQEAYVRKVIDMVNDLDNVLYEITNEDNGTAEDIAWQYHMIDFIKKYESGKPKQHMVGMTVQWPDGKNSMLFNSPADWISPNGEGGFQTDPPAADGSKVILNDTDHSFYYIALQKAGLGSQRAWVWKNFTRGNQTMFMDPYIDPTPWYVLTRNSPQAGKPDPYWDTIRQNMGYTRRYAEKMNLADATPQNGLSSTSYCLAEPGHQYLVYQPEAGAAFTVTLQAGKYNFEWFNPVSDTVAATGTFTSGEGSRSFTPPFNNDAVLYLTDKSTEGMGK
ncbi:MAG TPA: DUF6298 domain-containing protein [archaeon]|nr:DUF6298 domain-containing protein [archaeon]